MSQTYILDTNIVNSLYFNDKNAAAIRARIAAEPDANIYLCTVTIDELFRGALGEIRADEKRNVAGSGHTFLTRLIPFLAPYRFLPYDDAANAVFLAFPAAVRRAGAADCRIAAVAQVTGAVVVTRNTKHFSSITGTRHEDWTQAVTP